MKWAEDQILDMLTAGLRDSEIARLTLLKEQIESGQRSEITMEHRRLEFVAYLRQTGRLRED